MKTLRDKINDVVGASGYTDAIMTIIANHIEWSDPKSCRFGHVFSDRDTYEITSANEVYYLDDLIGMCHTLDDAKQLAQKHKEGLG